MKILVVNAGSSTLKYQFIDMEKESVICSGNCENIGEATSCITHKKDGKKYKEAVDFPNHYEAFKKVLEVMTTGELKALNSIDEIYAIGHRIVHGKDFIEPTYVTDEVITELENIIDYAPLHTPGAVAVIRACKKLAPNTPNVTVFDTAFHATMSDEVKLYAIPSEYVEKYGIKKYGAHGSSHKFIAQEVEKYLGKKECKLINCHIGSGASICAIKDGKCVDTSMGFTPLAGLVMGTRSGDIDPAIVSFVCEKENLTASEFVKILNKKSGLLGICGTNNSLILERMMAEGDEKAILAFNVMVNSIVKYIGAYIAELGGVDVISFTAGIGENSPLTRAAVLDKLKYLGIEYDKEKNDKKIRTPGIEEISTPDSKVKVLVIPTDEEIVIARETLEVVNNLK